MPDGGVEQEGRIAESGCVCEDALGRARCSSTLLRYHSSNPVFQIRRQSDLSETIPQFRGSLDVSQRASRFPEGLTVFLSFLTAWSLSRSVTPVRLPLALADSALHIPWSQTLQQAAVIPSILPRAEPPTDTICMEGESNPNLFHKLEPK